jgi:hypothetical protein
MSRIWIKPFGNAGNRALQYLAAAGIRQHAPDARIENIHLPEWGLHAPAAEPPLRRSAATGHMRFQLDVAGFADCLRRGVIDTVMLDGYAFHLDNYPPRDVARALLPPMPGGAEATGFGADELVCSLRGAEILDGAHPDYFVLPPAYYRQLVARSGLTPVFFGQIGDNHYSASLRAAFPNARFIEGRSVAYDFETLRRSVNIAPSISTFAWLAAWLSEAARIFMPVGGIFSPVQLPSMLFLPLDDPAFHYTLLPYAKAAKLATTAKFFLAQERLGALARAIEAGELRAIIARATSLARRLPLLTGFSEDFYLATYPDIAHAVAATAQAPDGLHSGLEHYQATGFFEGRQPLALDQGFYAATYPDAAMAIAEGRYADPLHHYQALGIRLGYRPTP